MFFRFGSAIFLVVLASAAGIALEKRNLELRREVSHQRYQLDVLTDRHAKLRLKTQQLGAPARMLDSLEKGELQIRRPEKSVESQPRRVPLLFWQRSTPTTR
jgi:hypothetical protein